MVGECDGGGGSMCDGDGGDGGVNDGDGGVCDVDGVDDATCEGDDGGSDRYLVHECRNHPLQFIVTCDHLTERVQGSFPKISSPQSLSTLVSQLNHDYKTLKGILEEIRAKGDNLVAHMCKVMTEGQPTAEYRYVCMCM